MYRVRYGRKTWRTRWPWSWLYPLTIDERFCRKCGLPYHNGPLPKEVTQFISGNVAAFIFPAGNWNGRAYVARFGRWKSQARDFSSPITFLPRSSMTCSRLPDKHTTTFANSCPRA